MGALPDNCFYLKRRKVTKCFKIMFYNMYFFVQKKLHHKHIPQAGTILDITAYIA